MLLKKLLAILCLSTSMTVYAASSSDTVTNLLMKMHTMQADFTQNISTQKERSGQATRGQMALQRPGKFRWDIKKPVAQLIIANGTRLWVYDKDLEQVTIRKFNSAEGQTPALLLSDKDLTLGKDYIVKDLNNGNLAATQTFLLLPKNKDNSFESIRLDFMQQQIKQMELKDRLGHTTTIRFQNIKLNAPLAAALFTFNPPAHVDVIDETKRKR